MVVIEIIGGTLLLMSAVAFLLLAVLDLATVDAVSATAATTSNAVATLRQVAAGAITARPWDDHSAREAPTDQVEVSGRSSIGKAA